jgi:hypothetical protein
MSQQHDSITPTTTIRKQRRTRQRHNQPALVATTEINHPSLQADELIIDTDTDNEQEIETTTTSESVPETKAPHLPHLPKFFSRVDKSEQKEEEVVKARLTRANHDKVSRDSKASTIKAYTKNDTKLQSKTTERREPLFKIRHFVGMTIYLFGAEFILPYEFALAHQLGMDHPFYTLTIFNNPISLSSAIFLNIATLILLLYVLVKLDLLPNTASAKLRAEQKAREQQSKNRQNAAPVVKNVPPPMKLGVKGQDDDLYQAYRSNQRREKKR